jgi:hypothetical protein
MLFTLTRLFPTIPRSPTLSPSVLNAVCAPEIRFHQPVLNRRQALRISYKTRSVSISIPVVQMPISREYDLDETFPQSRMAAIIRVKRSIRSSKARLRACPSNQSVRPHEIVEEGIRAPDSLREI